MVRSAVGCRRLVTTRGRRAERRPSVTSTGSTTDPAHQRGERAFYDARRGVHYTKPALRGWLHLLGFVASLVVGILLLSWVRGGARIAAGAIYAASVSALFGASALYHRGNWTNAWRR